MTRRPDGWCARPATPSGGKRPAGVFDTKLAGEGLGLLVDRPEIWLEHWLAARCRTGCSTTATANPSALYQPDISQTNGRLFFNSPDALVPADQNDKEDVYEYEPEGVGSCTPRRAVSG